MVITSYFVTKTASSFKDMLVSQAEIPMKCPTVSASKNARGKRRCPKCSNVLRYKERPGDESKICYFCEFTRASINMKSKKRAWSCMKGTHAYLSPMLPQGYRICPICKMATGKVLQHIQISHSKTKKEADMYRLVAVKGKTKKTKVAKRSQLKSAHAKVIVI